MGPAVVLPGRPVIAQDTEARTRDRYASVQGCLRLGAPVRPTALVYGWTMKWPRRFHRQADSSWPRTKGRSSP